MGDSSLVRGAQCGSTLLSYPGPKQPYSSVCGCDGFQLDRHVPLCFSPIQPHSIGNSKMGRVEGLHTNPLGTSVDTESMVSRSTPGEEGRPVNFTQENRSSKATPQQEGISRGTTVGVSSVAIVTNELKARGFSSKTAARAASSCRSSTVKSYDLKLNVYFDWAERHDFDPLSASLPQIAEFFEFLFSNKHLAPRTIRSYRSAISKIHPGWDGVSVGRNKILSDMISAYFIERPPVRKLLPNWSLQLVLRKLCDFPFEPLVKAELKWLTLKTVFLVAIASGRRVSCLHALCVGEGHIRENQSGTTLIPFPGFLAKNDSINYMAKSIFFTKMSKVSSVPEDRLLCPCRALSCYLKRCAGIRGGRNAFF